MAPKPKANGASVGGQGKGSGEGDGGVSLTYFDNYAGFHHDPTASLIAEFNRLAVCQGWQAKSKQYRQERAHAAVEEFNAHFGTNANRLDGWQKLCKVVGVVGQDEDAPGSITKCKKLLEPIHVNIFDLIDAVRTNVLPVKTFVDLTALKKNARKKKKIFPKDEAKQNYLLKAMLRKLGNGGY